MHQRGSFVHPDQTHSVRVVKIGAGREVESVAIAFDFKRKHNESSLSGGSKFEERRQPPASARPDGGHIQSGRMGAILRARQVAGFEKQFKRGGDPREFVAEKCRELLTREERPRMSSKKYQQIQIGSMPQDSHLIQHTPSVFVFHGGLPNRSRTRRNIRLRMR